MKPVIIKRDGCRVPFNGMRIIEAVAKSAEAVGVKDLAYCLRARAPKLVLVQGSVNDGKPMLTVMLGEEITAQGVNAGAVVREAAKLMQGGGGGQAFFATAGGKNPDGLQAAIDKAVELIMAQVK